MAFKMGGWYVIMLYMPIETFVAYHNTIIGEKEELTLLVPHRWNEKRTINSTTAMKTT